MWTKRMWGWCVRANRFSIYLQADQAVPVPGSVDLISPKGTKIRRSGQFRDVDQRGG